MIRWILIAILCWPLAASAEVYKWVDKDGNAHFTDQKPDHSGAVEKVDTSASELSESRREAARQREQLLKESAAQTEASREASIEQQAEQKAARKRQREQRAQACETGRQNLAMSENSSRIFTIDEDGNRTYLGDDERVARIEANRKIVAENCN